MKRSRIIQNIMALLLTIGTVAVNAEEQTYTMTTDAKASDITVQLPNVNSIVMEAGTLYLNQNLEGVTLTVDTDTGAIDPYTETGKNKDFTVLLKEIALEANAHLTVHSPYCWKSVMGGTPVVSTIEVEKLTLGSGEGLLTVGRWSTNESNESYERFTALVVAATEVGDGAKLTVNGLSSETDNTLGALTLGKDAKLELAGHRSTGSDMDFHMTVGGNGVRSNMAEGSLILISPCLPTSDADKPISTQKRYAYYTLAGEFDVASSKHGDLVAPTEDDGFGTTVYTAEVLRDESKNPKYVVNNNATWYLNGTKATASTVTKDEITTTTISAEMEAYDTWYQISDKEVSVSDILQAAGEYASLVTTVNLNNGTLNVDSDINTVNANDNVSVKGENALQLGKVFNIAEHKVVTFIDGIQQEGLSIVGTGGTKVTVENTSDSVQEYSLDNGDIVLTASQVALIEGATQDATVGNQVHAATIANNSTGGKALTMSNGASGVQHISAVKGDIFMKNMGANPLSVESMTIGEGQQVGLYTGSVADPAQEAAVSISGVLSAKGGTVLSDLAMADNSTLDLVGGQMTMAGNLSFGSNIYLDAATMANLDELAVGDTYEIIRHDDDAQITGNFDGKWYGEIFSRVSPTPAGGSPYELQGDYQLIINEGGNVAFRKVSDTPEPTTGTLSLLALAGLCIRRRK